MQRLRNIVIGALMASGLAFAAVAPAMAHSSYGGGTRSAYSAQAQGYFAPVVQSYSTGSYAEVNRDRSFEYGQQFDRHRDAHDRMSMRDGRGSGFRGERGDYRR
jgi:hypothetical protein